MTKLHFYRNIGNFLTKLADGDGTLKSSGSFDVRITYGKVEQGYVYEIREGQSTSGQQYNCTKGAGKNEDATFLKTPDHEILRANEEYFGAVLALQAANLASKKSVTIEINEDDFQLLKGANYKLCFAKKVAEGAYNVVWQSYTKYLVTNTFSWTPQYQLFGSNQFHADVDVVVGTNIVSIGLGESSTLSQEGILSDPSTGGPETSITLINNYDAIHPGVNQMSTGIDGKQISTPIYVAPESNLEGEATLTPVEKVLVWFEQDIHTSTMFSSARTRQVEIDLTTTNTATRLYQNQSWSTP